ncbi:MAG: hypothetical protein JW744_05615 [Candidatus Diapherotrites archaeon]|uniref:Uncharacterized protein n=1 Tax=Candidatus Iainarchaeum sp. TaxID=3101447 RepID=A0A938YVJ6_9ARCH|nr:hypothetical protein [Candidatus Diapherotrites archaeon]
MRKEIAFFALLLAAIALSGCALPGTGPSNGEPEPEPLHWEYQCENGAWVRDIATCTGGSTPTAPTAPTAQDCGSVENSHLVADVGSQTDAEKAAIACFNEKMVSCTESSFELTGAGGAAYNVISRDGDDCVMSISISSTGEEKTCRVPISFIASSEFAAEQSGQPEMIVFMVGIGMIAERLENTVTGQEVIIDCGLGGLPEEPLPE